MTRKDFFFAENILEAFNLQAVQKMERDGELESRWAVLVATTGTDIDYDVVWTIIALINIKVAEGTDAFDLIVKDSTKFTAFFEAVVALVDHNSFLSHPHLQLQYVSFLVNAYQCMEKPIVRQLFIGKCLSLALWKFISSERLDIEIKANPGLQKHWDNAQIQTIGNVTRAAPVPTSAVEPTKKGGKRKMSADADAVADMAASGSAPSSASSALSPEVRLLPTLVDHFLTSLSTVVAATASGAGEMARRQEICHYLQKFTELINDLLSQLATRRFLRTYLDDTHFIVMCRLLMQIRTNDVADGMEIDSASVDAEELRLLSEMLDRIDTMMNFEIDDLTGRVLTSEDLILSNNTRVAAFQQVVYSEYGIAMREVYFSSIGQLCQKDALLKHLNMCNNAQLLLISRRLGIFSEERDTAALYRLVPTPAHVVQGGNDLLKQYLVLICISYLSVRESQLEGINRLSLYPSEDLLWDMNQLPAASSFAADGVTAGTGATTNSDSGSGNAASTSTFLTLPKLNLQFLTMYDYLLRNFILFRLESAYEIRQAIMESVRRMMPKRGSSGTIFSGWSRMAQPITSISINEVSKPHIGENIPGRVTATVEVDLAKCNSEARMEWESLREHDVLFLVGIHNPLTIPSSYNNSSDATSGDKSAGRRRQEVEEAETRDFRHTFGVRHVRGGEVFEVRDQDNVVLNDMTR